MLTPGEAMVIEYKALKCLRQGQANVMVARAAERFAWRAVKHLGQEYSEEAASIALHALALKKFCREKLLTITQTNAI